MTRRPYLDWLRGIAVLIMIEGHTFDSWTREADQSQTAYRWAMVVAGFGAPVFLFLAGITLTLAAAARLKRGLTVGDATRSALQRGAWILALAFLFRLQSLVVSGGSFPRSLLKVDILNIMGVSMLVGALAWGAASTRWRRTALFAALTVTVAMLTPLVRHSAVLTVLPDPLEAYLRPLQGLTTFSLFPWAGFFSAGCIAGTWLASRPTEMDGSVMRWIAAAGTAATLGGYGLSFLPSIYARADFWTTSPSFFLLRVGVLLLTLAAAEAASRLWRSPVLEEFGRASLFVYWIHVELVYGTPSTALHGQLPFPVTVFAFAIFTIAMFALVRLKAKIGWSRRSTETPTSSRDENSLQTRGPGASPSKFLPGSGLR